MDEFGAVVNVMRAQRGVRSGENPNDEIAHPAWPQWRRHVPMGLGLPSCRLVLDRGGGLGYPPKLNPGFRVRRCFRQLYFEEPRAARSNP